MGFDVILRDNGSLFDIALSDPAVVPDLSDVKNKTIIPASYATTVIPKAQGTTVIPFNGTSVTIK